MIQYTVCALWLFYTIGLATTNLRTPHVKTKRVRTMRKYVGTGVTVKELTFKSNVSIRLTIPTVTPEIRTYELSVNYQQDGL